jgi:glycosyltransferase involved in cell wall biosynthesis
MIEVHDRPLITFALFAYNQEKFIREAVEGAFAQTYSPLEIILSDDSSSDSTFEIMKALAGSYRGPHRVVLNRNPFNYGIGRHVNRVMDLASGELIVAAAGDDISQPQRAQRIVEFWEAGKRRAYSIASYFYNISAGQRVLVKRVIPLECENLEWRSLHLTPGVLGAAHAWHRRVFDVFGPLNSGVEAEDRVIPFRSYCLGAVETLPEPLVYHRLHDASLSSFPHHQAKAACAKYPQVVIQRRQVLLQYLTDLDHPAFQKFPAEQVRRARRKILRAIEICNAEEDVLFASCVLALPMLVRAVAKGARIRYVGRKFLVCHAPQLYDFQWRSRQQLRRLTRYVLGRALRYRTHE